MKVLIAVEKLGGLSGAELYVRDLAQQLIALGHQVVVTARVRGPLVGQLERQGVPVLSEPRGLPWKPDVIHGQGEVATLMAVTRLPDVPAVFVCHNHEYWMDRTPLHRRIVEYVGVSRVCVNRLLAEGAPPQAVRLVSNWVDLSRFEPRSQLPTKPERALVFSNYATEKTHLPAVRAACAGMGVQLDVIGLGVGRQVSAPETVLPHYDLVFAKAKAAMEAMAVGSAVILCDFAGCGPLVTTRNMTMLLPMNFGFEALHMPYDADHLAGEIAAYSADDAAGVSGWIRSELSIDVCVRKLVSAYEDAAGQAAQKDGEGHGSTLAADYGQLLARWPKLAVAECWWRIPHDKRERYKQLRLVAHVHRMLRPKDAKVVP